MFYSIALVLFFPGLVWAANFRDLAKSIYVGSAVNTEHLNESLYDEITRENFNMLTPEWEMKWTATEAERGVYNYTEADKLVVYAHENGIRIRGHTLVWHRSVPDWVNELDKNSLHDAMTKRIINEMEHYKGQIYAWDVVNEAIASNGELRESFWYNNFGESYISDAFRIARKTDPKAKLYINDYFVEAIDNKSTGLYNLVKRLKKQGVPIDGVGIQGHVYIGNVSDDFEANLRRFIDLGVEVAITELTVMKSSADEQLDTVQQGKDYAKIFEICQKVDRCVGVSVWGWIDKYCFGAELELCLWYNDYTPKPAVQDVKNVLR